ncbi:Crp/Fnr family transcriptional regulator [Thiomonas bhubaneswarensis]|uniref:cAMP-binding domain of CRP or a regulatory subunit of cAMP-dependent protein kinases n=1 Tax=Thiomonas bhubaneswarensis TaxID=339866 RepID=A0A0K6HVA9_9BURK|nr:Crp/Fnr family transcriptional regulator [Thiomonas bhubaneswarensis]CUA94849.1 cAMP-binding domain of CRP or a regulatory subunit of cAMP-dependent protein kinases [Thiomonas bhubaneswarensis]
MNEINMPVWAARSGWWERLLPHEKSRVASEVGYQTVPAGEMLQPLGEPALHWVGVMSGLAKFVVTTSSGKELVYSGVGAGGWFGEGTLMRRGVWRYQAQAVRTCELALIPRESFLWLLERNIAFNHYLLQQLNDRLELMTLQALDDQPGGAESSVARTLRHLFHPLAGANGGALRVTQSEIGQLCRLSRQRVNQAFKRLQADGALQLRYGGVEILDPERLRAWEFRAAHPRGASKSYTCAPGRAGSRMSASSAEPPGCGTRG